MVTSDALGKRRLAYSVVTRAEQFAGITATDAVTKLLAPFRLLPVGCTRNLSAGVGLALRAHAQKTQPTRRNQLVEEAAARRAMMGTWVGR